MKQTDFTPMNDVRSGEEADRSSAATPPAKHNVSAFILPILLGVHAACLMWIAVVNSPGVDEPAHLVAGLSHWQFSRFDLYRVNPPLVRMIASAPILLTSAKQDWSHWSKLAPQSRDEFPVGKDFVTCNGPAAFWYLTVARWTCIPLCLLGMYLAYQWSTELYGVTAGILSATFYCGCPNMIAWGACITPDAGCASLGLLSAYAYRKWMRDPSWLNAVYAGLALGLAELSKMSWIILFAIWPTLWALHRVFHNSRNEPAPQPGRTTKELHQIALGSGISQTAFSKPLPAIQLVLILAMGLYVLNLGYGFRGTWTPLGKFQFVSQSLSGENHPDEGANRFSNTWAGVIPVPFPEDYVRGFDIQKYEFEQRRPSYLFGVLRDQGWWYYYACAFVLKTPVATIAIFLWSSMAMLLWKQFRSGWENELLLLLPPISLFALVSSQTGINEYLRYAIPVLPFVFIHTSRVATSIGRHRRTRIRIVAAACLFAATESAMVFPHQISFFNIAAGGPTGGSRYLLGANIDWCQDLFFLRRWLDSHPSSTPLHLAYVGDGDVDPKLAGIDAIPAPGFLTPDDSPTVRNADLSGPCPGWFAISIGQVKGYVDTRFSKPRFTYFQRLQPVASAGYSILIYHLTPEQAETLRRDLGFPPSRTE
ncbi:ArnT family glycosyltransferase [Schlesneria paludicola]|uniref:ArnT family glycosyltransferase n=1 Tax=Schlesneria paludicola TaxID=360056 RepID=UPI000299E4B8|nr:glycosyltransferase family 39 protein [Schlesneria paludicola]